MELIKQKIGRIREHLNQVEALREKCEQRFVADPVYRGAMLHYLYLLTDSCITLAEMVIKKQRLRLPQSYHESFDILGENGVLERGFAYDFAHIAGLRNFLAHDYEKIEAVIICRQVLAKTDDVRSYLEQVERALNLK
ncbi:type VII toxin-antitoxin system HepT family RNase toxin [Desulfurivibrio dismutans]|uniref:type VII toxin-antitoxin system HepT family RNase toxin n=1 Tax=Desulfurivibrio dismutans TaxID=1398908 RepID=UPI0023DA20C2|nr:DUF86 domain-containing protein [Desulfurivibrio alkaliphilus]MDF1613499.1 DUF86 domain-containing protein [Desulfurivibrio alkaliphilus]